MGCSASDWEEGLTWTGAMEEYAKAGAAVVEVAIVDCCVAESVVPRAFRKVF